MKRLKQILTGLAACSVVLFVTNASSQTAPSITTQPQSQTNQAGTIATFVVNATGTAPLKYQWRFNGTNLTDGGRIVGSTNGVLQVISVRTLEVGNYSVVVSNSYGNVISSNRALTVIPGLWPVDAADLKARKPQATDGNYFIDPDGPGPNPPFQVYCYGMATNPMEYLPLAYTGGTNNYSKFAAGGARGGSDVYTWWSKVRMDPLTLRLISYFVDGGNAGNNSQVAVEYRFTTSQGLAWYPPGATNASTGFYNTSTYGYGVAFDCIAYGSSQGRANINLTDTPFNVDSSVQFGVWPSSAGSASVSTNRKVVNITGGGYCGLCGPVLNGSASPLLFSFDSVLISTQAPPYIAGIQVPSAPLAQGANTNLTVAVGGAAPLCYQWLFNGTNIANGTNVTLALNNVHGSNTGNYSVIVTNNYGSATSSVVAVSVNVPVPPNITSNLVTQSTGVGSSVTFTVSATGSPLYYQWYLNGALVSGATGAALNIPAASTNSVGNYQVVVWNSAGTNWSSTAALWLNNLQMYAGVNAFGPIGGTCQVQYATNLNTPVTWVPLQTATIVTNPTVIIDYGSAGQPQRFYQTVPQ